MDKSVLSRKRHTVTPCPTLCEEARSVAHLQGERCVEATIPGSRYQRPAPIPAGGEFTRHYDFAASEHRNVLLEHNVVEGGTSASSGHAQEDEDGNLKMAPNNWPRRPTILPSQSWCSRSSSCSSFRSTGRQQHFRDRGVFYAGKPSHRVEHHSEVPQTRSDEQLMLPTSYRSIASASHSSCSDGKPNHHEDHSFWLAHQSPEEDGRTCHPKPPAIDIEISPGVFELLRGSAETWAAVQEGFVCFPECCCCNTRLVCIYDAAYVLCPNCKVVHPLRSSTYRKLGVGLGLLASTIEGNT